MEKNILPYPKYKTTKLNWLKQVPADWDIKRASALFHEKKTLNKEFQFKQAFQFKFGEIVNKKQVGTVDELKETYQKYTIVDKDDIVVNGLNLNYDFITQRVGKVRESGIITSAYISISPQKEEIEPRYACYLLKTLDNRKMLNGMGTGIRLTLSFPELKKQYLPIPPLPEQIQIARYLDDKVALINKFIRDKKKEIFLLKEQKQAEINQAVTRGVNPNAKMKDSGISWIGEVPEHWEIDRIASFFSEVKESNSNFEFKNAFSFKFGSIVLKNEIGTVEQLKETYQKYTIVEINDIIVNGLNLNYDFVTQRVAIVPFKGIITSAYISIRPKSNINPLYACHLLKSFDNLKMLNGLGTGIRLTLNYSELKKVMIPYPSFQEQHKIVEYIKKIEERLNKAINSIENQITLMQDYKVSLISDVVTGKVDVRNIVVEKTVDDIEEELEEVDKPEELDSNEE